IAVIEGRMGLLDAAARFRALNAFRPGLIAYLRTVYPSASDEECICRNVIGYVEHHLPDVAPQHPVSRRLRAELEQSLAQGAIKLPDPRSSAYRSWAAPH